MEKPTALTTKQDPQALAVMNNIMHQAAGQAANESAARHASADHTARKADNTLRRKIADLAIFETFLQSAGIPAPNSTNKSRPQRSWTGTPGSGETHASNEEKD